MNKGDFVGRDALLQVKAEGLRRKLCTITLTPGPSPAGGGGVGEGVVLYGGECVYHAGDIVSRLRSAGWGYTVAENTGFIYLPLELSRPGTLLEVEAFGERLPAQVAADVLYDPAGARLRA
ncbi:MAG: aminomethyl transferase family protein [Chloroflexi bacterium]|nr:aminomethyl transferase family protein [Chloroflexota bacterium]